MSRFDIFMTIKQKLVIRIYDFVHLTDVIFLVRPTSAKTRFAAGMHNTCLYILLSSNILKYTYFLLKLAEFDYLEDYCRDGKVSQ